jgi:hypothetical protein
MSVKKETSLFYSNNGVIWEAIMWSRIPLAPNRHDNGNGKAAELYSAE